MNDKYLKIEELMQKNHLSIEKTAELMGISKSSMLRKKKRDYDWTIAEALKFKKIMNFDGSIEELFA